MIVIAVITCKKSINRLSLCETARQYLLRWQNSLLPKPTAAAVSSTLSALYISTNTGGTQGESGTPTLFPGEAALLSRSAPGHISDISAIVAHLTQYANSAANSLACSSILAGRASESDEYGDVAFYLGLCTRYPGEIKVCCETCPSRFTRSSAITYGLRSH